jgi:autotransporter-associated beta strand protein
MLDIDRALTVSGAGPITFDSGTSGINAVLFGRNTNPTTSKGEVVNVPMVLVSPLEMDIDSSGGFDSNGQISGPGGIIKNGNGNLMLGASNTFTGGINVNDGTITALVPGSLGNGTVMLGGGMINVMTPNPFSGGGGTIVVQSNSQVNVGTFGGNVNYNVGPLGCISGSAQQLQSLVIGSNFFPSAGSVISHQTFDTTPASGNPSGLPNVPTYIFGISNDFTDATDSITVGNNSGTPWLGFGSDIQPRTFGALGNGQTLGISGHAQLVALGSILTINAKVTGASTDSISKQGAGLVVIDSSSSFSGSTTVDGGPMAINGTWNGPITITSGATLGGGGTTTSTLSFQGGSTFQPGVGAADNNATNTGNQPVTPAGHTFHSGPANFSVTTHILYDLNTPNVVGGADNDLLMVTGDISLSSAILDINGGVDFSNGTYTLMEATGAITGSLTPGSIPLDDFPGMQIEVINGAGGGEVLLSVPEPATAALLATIGATLLTRRRSRLRQRD